MITKYYVVRDDGARVGELFLGDGVGFSPRDAQTENKQLADALKKRLEQERRGGVSFGRYDGR